MTRTEKVPFVTERGERYLSIPAVDQLPTFFMTLVSSSDHWLFVASNGGLTAGRVSPDHSVFPYESVDKVQDSIHTRGPITLIRTESGAIWQPFSPAPVTQSSIKRSLYKHVLGCRLIFEERNEALGLTFRYRWSFSEKFGIVREAELHNDSAKAARVEILDGLRGLIPAGIPMVLEADRSCLTDAYKASELVDGQLAVLSLTAAISDRAAPLESLLCNTVWFSGLDGATVTLDSDAVAHFHQNRQVPALTKVFGRKPAFLLKASLALAAGKGHSWFQIADVNKDHVQVEALRQRLKQGSAVLADVEADVQAGVDKLRRLIHASDGAQCVRNETLVAHHAANVLFNDMRGGIFEAGYEIRVADFKDFVRTRNRSVFARLPQTLATANGTTSLAALRDACAGDVDLQRLSDEYLPLVFSRRHGDPSRPWNRFEIKVRTADGAPATSYQGNWRDIFQNWEALCLSFPDYLPNVISKFLNASTMDGHNPYRITREGIDWEVAEPDDPFSNIGYWGDHQIVYLLRLLEWQVRFFPGTLEKTLAEARFAYADVPYNIRPFEALYQAPRDAIEFDVARQERCLARSEKFGSDGRLVHNASGAVLHVTLLEKLLVTSLAKLSSLIPEAGIWLNTQRPEWNDANNALVGEAASMVTLYHLRRFVVFVDALLERAEARSVEVSHPVVEWFERLTKTYARFLPQLETGFDPASRYGFTAEVGQAFSDYRAQIYSTPPATRTSLKVEDVRKFLNLARGFLEQSEKLGRRTDGLLDAYNLLRLLPAKIEVQRMPQMLEGQAAGLSSGGHSAASALAVIESVRQSGLYWPEQNSYLLYPAKVFPSYLERNHPETSAVEQVALLTALCKAEHTALIAEDSNGQYRFNGSIRNAEDLTRVLDSLAAQPKWQTLVAQGRARVLQIFEDTFRHSEFTGRSGTMFGYEGIGCIYWHQVSKYLLAAQECFLQARDTRDDAATTTALAHAYYAVRDGLCFNKTPTEYGAFPTDPYSHTPPDGGARQPGMTGQVKEGILARFGELGVRINDGTFRIETDLLRAEEFLTEDVAFTYHDVQGAPQTLALRAGQLAFTFCQVPVVFTSHAAGKGLQITLTRRGGSMTESGRALSPTDSTHLFSRTGEIVRIDVQIPKETALL